MRPLFLDGRAGPLFCVYHPCRAGNARYRVLFLPPFAEELNKCRHLMHVTAVALATRDCDVLVCDVSGTGDSAGDFRDARWDAWVDDLRVALAWLADESPARELALIAVRAGALFLNELGPDGIGGCERAVLWQPVYKGEQFLKQLLRLRVMSNRFAGIDESVNELMQRFDDGENLEVAGYDIDAALARALITTELTSLPREYCGRVDVLEFRPSGGPVSAATAAFVGASTGVGGASGPEAIVAEQFWATQEVVAPPAVVDATAAVLGS